MEIRHGLQALRDLGRRWFQVILAGREFAGEWPEVHDRTQPDLRAGVDDTMAHWVAYYREQIAESRAVSPAGTWTPRARVRT